MIVTKGTVADLLLVGHKGPKMKQLVVTTLFNRCTKTITFFHLSKNIGQLIKCMFLNIEKKLEEGREFIYEAQKNMFHL